MAASVPQEARPRMPTRRQALAALALPAALPLAGCWEKLGLMNPCANRGDPGHRVDPRVAARAWAGLDPARVLDMHVHVAGEGSGPGDPWCAGRPRRGGAHR